MSSWWSIYLFVVGDFNQLEEFDQTLPSLFHKVMEVERPTGALVAHVAQNYGGEATIDAVIARYPDLIFSGTMTHEQAQWGDGFSGFSAIKGNAEWAAFSLPDDHLTVSQIDRWASRVENKIARLTNEREFCTKLLEQVGAKEEIPTEPVSDPPVGQDVVSVRTEGEVRAILDRLRAEN